MAKKATRRRKPAAKQAERQSRWITVHTRFNYMWPSRAVTYFHTPGEYCVKSEVADFAVTNGYATEGKQGDSAAEAADTGPATSVGGEDPADADRPADGRPVDQAAG